MVFPSRFSVNTWFNTISWVVEPRGLILSWQQVEIQQTFSLVAPGTGLYLFMLQLYFILKAADHSRQHFSKVLFVVLTVKAWVLPSVGAVRETWLLELSGCLQEQCSSSSSVWKWEILRQEQNIIIILIWPLHNGQRTSCSSSYIKFITSGWARMCFFERHPHLIKKQKPYAFQMMDNSLDP